MDGPRLNPHLLKVPLYIAGKSVEEVAEELNLSEVIKLASNESPIGPSPYAVEAARSLLGRAHRYPGISERDLCRKLAAHLGSGLDERNFLVGNGGTDALRMVTQAFVFDGGNTVMGSATFPMYHILTTTFGGTPIRINMTSDYRFDLVAMAEEIDSNTRIVFLCSPNNPTGQIITQVEADAFLARVPDHVVVVFDESYFAYVTDPANADSLSYIREGRSVFVVRSFSKEAGLANLRVGYLVGPKDLIEYVGRTRLPFSTGDIVLEAAAASLDDATFHARSVEVVFEGRKFLYSSLLEMNLKCLTTQANFLVILDPPMDSTALAEALLGRGIVVRPMAAFGMPNAVRVTVGTQEENEIFIENLKKVLEEIE